MVVRWQREMKGRRQQKTHRGGGLGRGGKFYLPISTSQFVCYQVGQEQGKVTRTAQRQFGLPIALE